MYYAKTEDVVASVVAGRIIMRERRILGFDADAALAAVKRRMPRWRGLLRDLGSPALAGDACLC